MKKNVLLLLLIVAFVSCKNNSENKEDNKNTKQTEKTTKKNCTTDVQFGDTAICLPKVSEWVECYENSNVKQRFDPYDTSNNTTLGYYLSNKTFKNIDNLAEITFDDYFKIYAPNQGKNKNMTVSEMKEVVKIMSGSFISKTLEETNKDLQKKGKKILLSRPILLDRYDPQSNASSVVVLMSVNNGNDSNVLAMQMTATIVKKRMVFIAYYLNFKDENTLKMLKKNSDLFIKEFTQANS